MKRHSRRQFLSICACAGILSTAPFNTLLASTPLHHWTGIVFGTEVRITLAHPDKHIAQNIFEKCFKEVKRLENIFTLYDSQSEISQLNAKGSLQTPSPELVDILKKSAFYHELTQGAFDITVKALEENKSLSLVGMDKLHFTEKDVFFSKKRMAITLNGIAQGYITDHATNILKEEGLQNVLVELGEKFAIGDHPEERPWYIAVEGRKDPIPLMNKALATSSNINPNTGKKHIYNPVTGMETNINQTVSVIANTATAADALATSFLSMNRKSIEATIESHDFIQTVIIDGKDIQSS